MQRVPFRFFHFWVVAGLLLGASTSLFAEEKPFARENRDKQYEFFGRDGHLYDSTVEEAVQTLPAGYGKLISVLPSPSNPRGRELWFEANDGTVRRVVLVPVKNRRPPFLIYRDVLRLERD